MNLTERLVMRKAQKDGYTQPNTKVSLEAAQKLAKAGLLVVRGMGYAVTDKGRAVDASERKPAG